MFCRFSTLFYSIGAAECATLGWFLLAGPRVWQQANREPWIGNPHFWLGSIWIALCALWLLNSLFAHREEVNRITRSRWARIERKKSFMTEEDYARQSRPENLSKADTVERFLSSRVGTAASVIVFLVLWPLTLIYSLLHFFMVSRVLISDRSSK